MPDVSAAAELGERDSGPGGAEAMDQPQLGAPPDLETPVKAFTNRELSAELTVLGNWAQVTTLTDEGRRIVENRLDEVRAEAAHRGINA